MAKDFSTFDLERFQREVGDDFKLVHDVFCVYFLSIMEGKDKVKHASVIPVTQIIKINEWIATSVIPFYEKQEDYEKCARLKKVVDFLKEEKGL